MDKIVKSVHPGSMFYSENETGSDLVGSLGLMILHSVRIFMNSVSCSGNESAFDQALEFVKNESLVEASGTKYLSPWEDQSDLLKMLSTGSVLQPDYNIVRGRKCSNLNKINL